MTTHAMAFVKWNVFRPGRERPTERSFIYASRQRRLITLVGNGGTLWLATSRRQGDGTLRYSLAYKLVDCVARTPDPAKEERFGPNMVYGQDWAGSVHFPSNDAADVLRRLCFASGPPMSEVSNIGFRLQGIPRLAGEDVALLEAFQQKVLSERTVFLSYAHDTETCFAFLQQLWGLSIRSSRRVVVITDNVRYHHAALHKEWREAAAAWFKLEYLPPYSPDLNPIERVWKLTRRLATHNRYFPAIEDVIAAVEHTFEPWRKGSDVLRRLCAIT